MSRFYSTDANHSDIKQHLESLNIRVYDFAKAGDGFPDLLTVKNRIVCLIEIKFGKKAEIKKTQMKFIGNYPGYVGFAETIEEAEKLAKDPVAFSLTQKDKDKIAFFEQDYKQKKMHFETFKREVLGI